MTIKLSSTAEYLVDGDILTVTIYLVDGTTAKTQLINAGTCRLKHNNVVVQTVQFDKYNGNSDGPIKLAFNHPVATSPMVYVSLTLSTGETLEQIVNVSRIEGPDAPLAPNVAAGDP